MCGCAVNVEKRSWIVMIPSAALSTSGTTHTATWSFQAGKNTGNASTATPPPWSRDVPRRLAATYAEDCTYLELRVGSADGELLGGRFPAEAGDLEVPIPPELPDIYVKAVGPATAPDVFLRFDAVIPSIPESCP